MNNCRGEKSGRVWRDKRKKGYLSGKEERKKKGLNDDSIKY
jgi:hypothetical protein